MSEKKVLCYIPGIVGQGEPAGVIIGIFDKYVDIGTTEENGGDSHALLDLGAAKRLSDTLSEAIKMIENN